ncbi:alpha/beta fold hydrolase [Thermoleophilia bacterium SCSIO 60948]|nr:alpha/beta fold hydrolase [Thermoleophilia bacterium SCSIO 60948]
MEHARTSSRPRLYYEDTGNRAGEPFLFITGWTISAAVFEPVAPLYSDRFRVLSFDLRSTGRSERRAGLVSMADLAADAVRVLDDAGIVSAHAFGISMGGMIAQELAIRFPDRVRGLVLAGTWTGGPLAARPRPLEVLGTGRRIAAGSVERRDLWLGPLLFSERFLRERPHRAAELVSYFRAHRAPLWASASQLLGSVYQDTTRRLGEIRSPTLVMHGALDAMVPLPNARFLANRIPDAELAVLDGAGHAFPLEQPEHSRDLLFDWLDRREPIGPGARYDPARARRERIGRPFALPVGAARTGRSLITRALRG